MAGDWIKVEHSTLDKPEIFVMADQLGIDGDAVVGKCLRFWAWVDSNTVDGRVDVKVTAVRLQVDRLCSCKGFTDALISAGWLKVSDDGMSVEIPNFQYHNSESAKERALKTRRQQKWRDKTKRKSVDDCVDGNASTTASTTASIREEKRREEKNKDSLPETDSDQPGEPIKITKPNGKHSNKILFEKIAEIYNERLGGVMPNVQVLSEKRQRLLKARCSTKFKNRELDNPEFWTGYFNYVSQSEWLTGKNQSGWTADFDWLIEEKNFIRVLEGSYHKTEANA